MVRSANAAIPRVVTALAFLMAGSLSTISAAGASNGPSGNPGLSWAKCTAEELTKFQCATLVVPMDYSNPSGRQVRIAVARARATGGPGARIGSIIFNPGGPGEAAVPLLPGLVDAVPPRVRQRFDIVVFDPRGVGASRPLLQCTEPPELNPESTATAQDWQTYYTNQIRAQASALDACFKKHSPFIDHVGTNNVARDVDAIRRSLGGGQVNYWGVSYGTRIGATYAQMFPRQVRTMILDGNVPPNPTLTSFFTSTAGSRDAAFAFFQREYPQGAQAYLALTDRLKSASAKLPDGKELTASEVVAKLIDNLSKEKQYATTAGDFLSWADALKIPTSATSSETPQPLPSDNGVQEIATTEADNRGTAVLRAVNCIDLPGRDTPAQMAEVAAQAAATGPRFSVVDLSSIPICSGLPVRSDPTPQINGQGAPGALVINGAFDPLTPLSWAQQMAGAIRNSRLVVYQGAQHGVAYFMGSSCVDDVATTYLLTAQLPSSNVNCPTVRPSS